MVRFKALVLGTVLLGLAGGFTSFPSFAECSGKECKKQSKECDCQRKGKKKIECKDCEKKKENTATE